MSAWKYRQLMPKVLVCKLRLIQPKEILGLAGNPLDQICLHLAKTPYQKEISEIAPQQIASNSLEKALLKTFIRAVDEIAHYSPSDIRALLATVLMKFEAKSLKAILRTKSAGLEADQAMKYIVPIGRLHAAKCMEILKNSKNISDVVKLLSDSEYGRALRGALEEYEKTGVVFPLEAAVDRHVYSRIWRAAKKLRGLDGKIARTVIGSEIDSLNIKVVLRFREAGISEDQAKQYLVPISDVFSQEELESAMGTKDVDQALEQLLEVAKFNLATDYQHMLTKLIREYETHKSLSHLEMVLDRELLKTSLRMVKRYTPFFNIGFVLAFLNLKWSELRNLRTIIAGAEERIPSDKVKELLIFPS